MFETRKQVLTKILQEEEHKRTIYIFEQVDEKMIMALNEVINDVRRELDEINTIDEFIKV